MLHSNEHLCRFSPVNILLLIFLNLHSLVYLSILLFLLHHSQKSKVTEYFSSSFSNAYASELFKTTLRRERLSDLFLIFLAAAYCLNLHISRSQSCLYCTNSSVWVIYYHLCPRHFNDHACSAFLPFVYILIGVFERRIMKD